MGGYAALAAALQQPTAVASVFTWGTKFAWSPEGAAHETRLLNPAKVAEKVPHFAATLAQRHGPDRWQPLMQHTAAMMQQLGTHPLLTQDSLPQLQRPVQIAVGDSDTMVDIKETLWAYRLLPQAYLQVLPATQHPFETLSITELSAHIRQFIQRAGVSL